MIQTEGITKSFGALQVLKGIDLTINKGEVVAIVGPSGAGKTTLLQIIGTLDAPDSGRLVINGTETRRLGDKELAAFRNRNLPLYAASISRPFVMALNVFQSAPTSVLIGSLLNSNKPILV